MIKQAKRHPIKIEKRFYLATRRVCREKAPGVFFASHQLPKADRYAFYVCFAAINQLHEILVYETPKTEGQEAGCQGDGDCQSCTGHLGQAAGEEDAMPAGVNRIASIPSAGEGAARTGQDAGASQEACDSAGAKEEGCCSGESPEQKMAVCLSVLDYLFEGQATGKMELDGFYEAARYHGLSLDYFVQLSRSLADYVNAVRVESWTQLRDLFWGRAGAGLGLMHWLGRGNLDQQSLLLGRALGAGLELTDALYDVRQWDCDRFLLPRHDLEKFDLTESDIKGFAMGQASAGADKRWDAFVDFEVARGQQLLVAGLKTIKPLPSGYRSAIAHLALQANERLKRARHDGGRCFEKEKKIGWLGNAKLLSRTVKICKNPDLASQFIG